VLGNEEKASGRFVRALNKLVSVKDRDLRSQLDRSHSSMYERTSRARTIDSP
jgi:hypothetical protein